MGFGYSKQTTDATESIDQDNKDLYMLTHYLSHTKEEDNNIKNILEHKKALDYENIVFEGGGAKAMAFCGGILALDNLGIYKKLKRFAGSSAGAIVATLLAIGYTPSDLVDIMYDTDFGTFFNKSLFELPKDIYEVLKHEGCDSGEAFEDFIETRIETITGNKDYTFIDLYNDRKIELVITSTDVNREISVYFHHKATPHMTLRQAVRMSMSIPLIFTPVVHELAKKQDIFVDGGLLDNYPLHVFDGAYPGDPQAMMNLIAPNPKTIGLKLLTK